MSHIVKFSTPDGKTDYHHTDDIHDAVSFVEQLRNDQNVDGAQIFRLEEVNFDYRPYYRVELKATEPMLAAAPAPKAAVTTAPTSVKEQPKAAVSAAPAPAAPSPGASPKAEPELVTVPSAPAASKAAPTVAKPTVVKENSSNGTSADSGSGARRGLFGR